MLDLEPSGDFAKAAELIAKGKLQKYWQGVLGEGDLLYMPRGVVHFGKTYPEFYTPTHTSSKHETGSPEKTDDKPHRHSLHVTLSNQQHNSWADLLSNNS